MATTRQYAVLGPLQSGVKTRAFLGCEVHDGVPEGDRPVVIVWLPDDATSEPERVARLQRETAFVTNLRHDNIIRVFGLECFDEGWARVVSYVDGEPLHRVVEVASDAFKPLDARMIARLLVDLCDGVHYAHEQGQSRYAGRPIVHGGLRPDTVLVTFDGVCKVTGYGASVLAPTEHGVPIATKLVYFAPEQIIGGKATASPATDIYALGAILYELLAGQPPYVGEEDVERAILTGPPPILEADGLAGRLANIATTALAKRGTERFETVAIMKEAIEKAVADDGVEMSTHAEVAAFVSALIPPNAPERQGRVDLLASATDPDTVTVLSRPDQAPEGVDAALFEASRPGPVSTVQIEALKPERVALPREGETEIGSQSPPRTPLPRDEDTVVEMPRDATLADAKVASGDVISEIEETGAAMMLAINQRSSVQNEVAAAAGREIAEEEAEAAAKALAAEQAVAAQQMAQQEAEAQRARQRAAEEQLAAQQAAHAQQLAAQQQAAQQLAQAQLALQQAQMAAAPRAQAPVVPGPIPGAPPYPPQPYANPAASQVPYGQPHGYPPQPGQIANPYGQPHASQVPYGAPQPYAHPNASQVPYGGPQNYGHPNASQVPPPQAGQQNFLPQPNLHPAASQVPQFNPPPPQPPTQGTLKAVPMPAPIPGAVPRAPMRSESSITHFSQRTGDASRTILYLVVGLLVAAIAWIFVFPKEPPKGIDAPPERARLPKDLVHEALTKPKPPPVETPPAGAASGSATGSGSASGGAEASTQNDGPAALAKKRYGTLILSTKPRVDVYVQNKKVGRTPTTLTLETGRREIRFTDKRTGINHYRRFRILPEAEVKRRIVFEKGRLKILAPEGAAVTLNSKSMGRAPLEELDLYEGRYLLRIVHDGVIWNDWITVPAGSNLVYRTKTVVQNK